MPALDQVWDTLGAVFGGALGSFERGVTAIFGSANARQVTRMQNRVETIDGLESKYAALTDEELRQQTEVLRGRLRDGETLDDILEDAFAVCREGGKRFLSMRHYGVQLIGGMVLHIGGIAEMVTGEGKTLVATLPAYLNALEGKGVHVITVNDYLARRDMEWMAPLYLNLGLTVSAIQKDMSTAEKQAAYATDITYGTNNEFGFDYLRDNMRPAAKGDARFAPEMQQCQGPLNYAIIDEVDNILIDEARTPLIISGPADLDLDRYQDADKVAAQLRREEHFTVDEKQHNVTLTDVGVREAEKLAGVESFYTAGNMEWPHLIDNALKARYLYKRDVNYVVKDRQIVIVDEFTGRLMEGRQWSDGLHQAVEAKENVPIKAETQTFATASLQNIFKMYKKLSGMTGTAMTEATEFAKIYDLEVVAIPTHRDLQRLEHSDQIYLTERDKYRALAEDVERNSKWDVLVPKKGDEVWGTLKSESDDSYELIQKGQKQPETFSKEEYPTLLPAKRPVLIGTVSIEKSERLSALLEKRGIEHEVLNAKNHGREADIVAQAGRLGAVTIATNMAGRGTDIILGGNPETMAWAQLQHEYPTRLEVPDDVWNKLVKEIDESEKMSAEGEIVRDIGGLYVMGTERHESRRIDLQLRGRCGRQGDPGSSRFFLSLEDDLMRIFAGDFVKSVMERMGMREGDAIESPMISRRIAAAQKKVEERNYEIRKSLLEYDEVMDEQRKRVYRYRQALLDGHSSRSMVLDLIEAKIRVFVETLLDPMYGAESFVTFAGSQLQCQLDAREFANLDFDMAVSYAKDQAERSAENSAEEVVEENLPIEMPDEWNWAALVNWAEANVGGKHTEKSLQSMDRDDMIIMFIKGLHAKIADVDLSQAAPMLEADYGLKTLAAWMKHRFGIEVDLSKFKDIEEHGPVIDQLLKVTTEAYTDKEATYPILTGISAYTTKQGAQTLLDSEGLVAWVNGRFDFPLDHKDLPRDQDDFIKLLLPQSRKSNELAEANQMSAKEKIEELFSDADDKTTAAVASESEDAIDKFVGWLDQELDHKMAREDISRMTCPEVQLVVDGAVDDKFHPEMRRMERQTLLTIVDDAWKNHLLTMDHLRSSVGLKGYAQMDPKVEYKREGMRLFDQMWDSIGERVTELIFRMESLNQDFVRSTFVQGRERHDSISTSLGTSANEDASTQRASDASAKMTTSGGGDSEPVQPETVRNSGPRVGRNDPCPCGSGRKYKQCCGRRKTV
ncbi:MAG: SEC-C metal-binding domain-containing protein [Planctomycetota bacterium]